MVQKLDSAIHRINPYPLDTYYELHYPLDSDLSGGWLYQPFEQLGPYGRINTQLVQLLRESLGKFWLASSNPDLCDTGAAL